MPGPRSAALASRLRRHEQRNVTYFAEDFPIFWESARGAVVVDVDGNEYVDCTAAFGVANAGHANPSVMRAVSRQAQQLAHGMGDVHPTEVRVLLLERLSGILPPPLTTGFLATTGSEAIEAALKTAMLVTGKSRFAAFEGGYHGLSFGALAVGGIAKFREPFSQVLRTEPVLLDYPRLGRVGAAQAAAEARDTLRAHDDLAAIVVEPIQGRGGAVVPPAGFLGELRVICDDLRILMIVDEIFTGFGRTGRWFAIDHENVVPDIICTGKAMGSGIPISAAMGRRAIMDAWPLSTGEALHTSTYLGNPIACAAAIATIDEMGRCDLPLRAATLGNMLGNRLRGLSRFRGVTDVRGVGLLWGVQLRDGATAAVVVRRALRAGVVLLQSGVQGETIALSPPLTIETEQLMHAADVLERALKEEE
ncbi:MAG: aminotransferase class III-fold pyridoxal phosphate-dependent enzyme [Candidatus Eremiobacteraeota bacterium]|nr:aminotransferase class III-fold pyridoxal phosphate-dependent enzyme [Candidatus Eremiobacteraeota bacterium]